MDPDFTKEVFDAMNRHFENLNGSRPAVSDEDDSRVLEEDRRLNEIKDLG